MGDIFFYKEDWFIQCPGVMNISHHHLFDNYLLFGHDARTILIRWGLSKNPHLILKIKEEVKIK